MPALSATTAWPLGTVTHTRPTLDEITVIANWDPDDPKQTPTDRAIAVAIAHDYGFHDVLAARANWMRRQWI